MPGKEKMNGGYSLDNVTTKYAKFCFNRMMLKECGTLDGQCLDASEE